MHGSVAFTVDVADSAMTACSHTGSNPQLLSVEVKLILLLRKELQIMSYSNPPPLCVGVKEGIYNNTYT